MATAFLTQRKAIALLREETGLSRDECTKQIKTLKTRLDGKRNKVSRVAVRNLITDLSEPPREKTLADIGLKPFRPRKNADWPNIIT